MSSRIEQSRRGAAGPRDGTVLAAVCALAALAVLAVPAEALQGDVVADRVLGQRSFVRGEANAGGIERVADVPIHFADPLVRRAPSLQATADAKPPKARVSRTLLDQLGLEEGAQIKIRQGRGEAVLATQIDGAVPPGVVRVAAAHPSTCGLEGLSGPLTVEQA